MRRLHAKEARALDSELERGCLVLTQHVARWNRLERRRMTLALVQKMKEAAAAAQASGETGANEAKDAEVDVAAPEQSDASHELRAAGEVEEVAAEDEEDEEDEEGA